MAFLPTAGRAPILYKESAIASSMDESYQNNAAKASRVFDVGFDDRWDFVREMIGWSEDAFMPDGVTRFIKRTLPKAYPVFTKKNNKPWLWARHASSIKGLKADGWVAAKQHGHYNTSRIKIEYESVPYSIWRDDEIKNTAGIPDEAQLFRYIVRTFQPSSEYLTFPRGAYKWVDDGVPANRAPVDGSRGRVVSFLEITYTWVEVPGVPLALASLIGSVNNELFDGATAETLLLVGATLKPYRSVVGNRVFDIEMKTRLFNPESGVGHNHFLRFKGDGAAPFYARITNDGLSTGTPVFPKKDFKTLFGPPYSAIYTLRDF